MSFRKWYINKVKKAVGKFDSYYVINELYDYLASSDEDTDKKLKHVKNELLCQINRVRLKTWLTSAAADNV